MSNPSENRGQLPAFIPLWLRSSIAHEPIFLEHIQMPHFDAREGKGTHLDAELLRRSHARRDLGFRSFMRTPRIAEDYVREGMTTDLLGSRAGSYLLYQGPAKKHWSAMFAS